MKEKFKTTPKQKAIITAWATFGFLYGGMEGGIGGSIGGTLLCWFVSFSYYYVEKFKKDNGKD
ncbi:hypothetical protein HQ529_02460 [Candidatus Woesearchaeota archaeon]|nr:hypothetical protein [Candidatus Woesearchaeota archaeon]